MTHGICTKCNEVADGLYEVYADRCWQADLCPKCYNELKKFLGIRHGILLELTKQEEEAVNEYCRLTKRPVEYNLANGTVIFQVKGGRQE